MNRFDDILVQHNSNSMMQSTFSAHNAFNIGMPDYHQVEEEKGNSEVTPVDSSTLQTDFHEDLTDKFVRENETVKVLISFFGLILILCCFQRKQIPNATNNKYNNIEASSLNHLVQNSMDPPNVPSNTNESTNIYGHLLDQVVKTILSNQNSSSNGQNGTNNNHHISSQNQYHTQNAHFSLSSNTLVLNRTITLDELRKYFHLPIAEVAKQFGTCTTALKKICRKLNITKWPYRQILSLTKSIQSLEMAALNEGVAQELRQQYRNQIAVLQKAITEVMKNPSKAMETLNQHLEFAGALIGEANLSPGDQPDQEAKANEAMQRMVRASTSGSLENFDSSSPPVRGASYHINSYRRSSKNGKRASEMIVSDGNEQSRLKRSKSEDVNINSLMGDTNSSQVQNHLSIGGMALNDRGNHETQSESRGDERYDRPSSRTDPPLEKNPTSSSGTSRDPALASMLSRPENVVAHAWSQYLLDVGLTTVQVNYNPEMHKYHFTGQVQLAPLHRRKLRPSTVGKVVPLMEPDIGSNYSVDFFPKLTLKK